MGKNKLGFKNSPNITSDIEEQSKNPIKKDADRGRERGIDPPRTFNFGKFPAPLVNPLALEGSYGDWKPQTPEQFLPYPGINAKTGFTNPQTAGSDYEYLSFDSNKVIDTPQPTIDLMLDTRRSNFSFYKDFSGKQFTHLLDYFQDQQGGVGLGSFGNEKPLPAGVATQNEDGSLSVTQNDTTSIYLGSFIRTFDDNEDPTMMGFDIEIKVENSPLFNGSIDKFITTFSGLGNSEIAARLDILTKFREQFFRFVKKDFVSGIAQNDQPSPVFNNTSGVKTYYLKKIGGLDNLVEAIESDKTRPFVEYQKDLVTLDFYEDVSQNIGYLATLYKMLSWSKLNGKQVIPDNLLRFDVDITITEVRKYNRVFKNLEDNSVDVYADLISKYTYTLYECQFFFPKLPHGDSIDMSGIKQVEDYQISFNYKYSTLKFSKFRLDPETRSMREETYDNKYDNVRRVASNATTRNEILNGSIVSSEESILLNPVYKYSPTLGKTNNVMDDGGILGEVKLSEEKKPFDKLGETLKKDLTNAVVSELNRQVIKGAALLNKTLENIRNSIPLAGRLSAPTNVYENNSPFVNDLTNITRNFVGKSLKSFFTKP